MKVDFLLRGIKNVNFLSLVLISDDKCLKTENNNDKQCKINVNEFILIVSSSHYVNISKPLLQLISWR